MIRATFRLESYDILSWVGCSPKDTNSEEFKTGILRLCPKVALIA